MSNHISVPSNQMISASDIERRVAIAFAIARYVKALDNYHAASHEFNEACSYVRSRLNGRCRFVTKISFQHFLVTADEEGNFEVEEIDLA